jgi:outer membrane protein
MARALEANPTVAGARAQLDIAEARRMAAFALVFPKIALTGDFTRNDESVSFGSGADERVILPSDDWSYQLTLRQPIFAGLREKRAYEQSKLVIRQSELGLTDAQAQLLLRVARSFLDAQEGQALVAVEQRNLALAGNRRKQASDFFEVGEVTRVDVLRADAGVKAAERRQVVAEAQVAQALGRLRVDLALDADPELAPLGDFLPELPALEALEAAALAASPPIEQARLAVLVAELEVKKQQGARWPVIFLDGGYITQKSTFPSDQYGFLALNVQVPIYQGGEIKAKVEEARASLRVAQARLEELERALRQTLRDAVRDVETARTLLVLARQEQAVLQQQYDETFALYRAQEATALDLDDAELSLADASRRVASAEIGVQTLELRVFYLAGRLADTLAETSTETSAETSRPAAPTPTVPAPAEPSAAGLTKDDTP